MVFLIQNTQNRDTAALQLKLDELILATKAARNSVAGIEDATDEELDAAKDDVRERFPTDFRRLPPARALGIPSFCAMPMMVSAALLSPESALESIFTSAGSRHPPARSRPRAARHWEGDLLYGGKTLTISHPMRPAISRSSRS
jgi:hypothetical protein